MKKLLLLTLALGAAQIQANYSLGSEPEWTFVEGEEEIPTDWNMVNSHSDNIFFISAQDKSIYNYIIFEIEKQYSKLNSYETGVLASKIYTDLMRYENSFYAEEILHKYHVKLNQNILNKLAEEKK